MSVECFVTGGSGFVGQHLLAHLTATGHKTWVLMRTPANIERLREQVGRLGGNPACIHAVEGDISREGLGLSEADEQRVSSASVVFHLAAQFSWGLTMERAREVNVQGALRVARLAASQRIRLLMVGGFMLQNLSHLASIGVDNECPETRTGPRSTAVQVATKAASSSPILRSSVTCRKRARITQSFILLRCVATARVGTFWKDNLWPNSFETWHKAGSKLFPVPPGTGCH